MIIFFPPNWNSEDISSIFPLSCTCRIYKRLLPTWRRRENCFWADLRLNINIGMTLIWDSGPIWHISLKKLHSVASHLSQLHTQQWCGFCRRKSKVVKLFKSNCNRMAISLLLRNGHYESSDWLLLSTQGKVADSWKHCRLCKFFVYLYSYAHFTTLVVFPPNAKNV